MKKFISICLSLSLFLTGILPTSTVLAATQPRDPNLIYVKISGYNSTFVRSHLPMSGNFTTNSRYAGKVLTIKIKTQRDSSNNFGFTYNNYSNNDRNSFNPFRRFNTNVRLTKYIANIDYTLEDKITGQIIGSGSSSGESTQTSPRFTTGFGSFSHQSTSSSTREDAVMDALDNLHINLNSVNYSSYQPNNCTYYHCN